MNSIHSIFKPSPHGSYNPDVFDIRPKITRTKEKWRALTIYFRMYTESLQTKRFFFLLNYFRLLFGRFFFIEQGVKDQPKLVHFFR